MNSIVKKAKRKHHSDQLNANANNPDKFWDAIKKVYPTKPINTNAKSFDIDGTNVNDSKQIATAFCKYFTNIVTKIKKKTFFLQDLVWRKPKEIEQKTNNVFMFKPVTTAEMSQKLKLLKRKKSAGLDNIPPSLLKDCADSIAPSLTYLISLSFKNGVFPTDWKLTNVVPVYKSSALNNMENYRPISVIPAISKVIESIVHEQLSDYLEKNNLLFKNQFGFRKNRSTETACTLFFDKIKMYVNKNKIAGAVFIDLKKAFDTIGHSQLISKLSKYGVEHTELKWFTDYLFNRIQRVQYDSVLSQPEYVLSGVPQGSILGPLLFIIFFNDLPSCLKYSEIIKYADDTVLFVSDIEFTVIESKLSSDMSSIDKWCQDNDLILNLNKGKTEAMMFGTTKSLSKHPSMNITYGHKNIEVIKTYKYLGVKIDSTLNLNTNFDSSYKRACGRLHLLRKIRPLINKKAAICIYQSMIVPVMTYCSILSLKRSQYQNQRLASLHARATKIVSKNDDLSLRSITNVIDKRACTVVRQCLDGNTCEDMTKHFNILNKNSTTRNGKFMLLLPKINLEYARSSFVFMGSSIYNALPLEIRKEEQFEKYRKLLNLHFN